MYINATTENPIKANGHEVYYGGFVFTWDKDRIKKGTSCSYTGETIEDALHDAIATAIFYLGLDYHVEIGPMEPMCKHCENSGAIKKGKTNRSGYKACPKCKGHGHFETILKEIPVSYSKHNTLLTNEYQRVCA